VSIHRTLEAPSWVRHGIVTNIQHLSIQGFVVRLLTVVHPSEPSEAPPSPTPPLPAAAAVDPEDDPFDLDNRILKNVFVRSAANNHNVTMHDVRLGMTVYSFREEYRRKQGTKAEHCRLIFSGKELENVRNGKGKSREAEEMVRVWESMRYELLLTSCLPCRGVCWNSYDLEGL
jgi:hypothetical protein